MNIKQVLKEQMLKTYLDVSEKDSLYYFFASGRINLIGEHIDYNGGYVFPASLDMGTYAAVRPREDRVLRLSSTNVRGEVDLSLDGLAYKKAHGWANYPKGIISSIIDFIKDKKDLNELRGMDIVYKGNIPPASGLSSSSSLLMLTGRIFSSVNKLDIGTIDLAKLSQQAENDFIGVKTGIMDQFAIGMGKKDKAILLDTASLNYEYVPFNMGDKLIIIGNTKKPRGLADSKYNERLNECRVALKDLQKVKKISNLCDLSPDEFEDLKSAIKDPLACKRARHAVYENQRVKQAVEALKNNDLIHFGKLLNESHYSLRDLYEVTGKELDVLTAESRKIRGVLGSRMTGAGFGGCAISLIDKASVDEYIEKVARAYEDQIGHPAEFYIARIDDGMKEL